MPAFPGRYFRQTLVTTAHHVNGHGGLGANRVNWITEQIAGTQQLGTHLDALSHLQIGGRGYNGWSVAELAGTAGVERLGAETVPQIVTRGWLVDVAPLRAGEVIGVPDIDPDPGDAVLFHTGWGSEWDDPVTYLSAEPGPGLELAAWLVDRGVALTGCDTWSYGPVPAEDPDRPFEVPQFSGRPRRRRLVCLAAGRRRSAAVNARSWAALEAGRQTWIFEAMKRLRTRQAPADDLAFVGSSVLRSGLATNLLWIGALKFKHYEVENIDPLLRSSPLFSRLREKLGARRLARVIGIAEIALGSVIAAKPVAPKASAAASLGAVGMFLTTLSFLVTTPEARQEGEGMLVPSLAGQFLLKDTVLLAAALLTAAESLRAAGR